MMLSRVGGSLYWMGRYLERAENVTRLLAVTSDFAIEFGGLDEALAQAEWDDLVRSLPGAKIPAIEFSPEQGLTVPYVNAMLLDDENPLSVRHSLGRARENARSIREALTQEVFANLNEAFRSLEDRSRKGIDDPAISAEVVAKTHRAILTTLGAIEHTLSRDQGWTFMKFGEALERTLRTLMILKAKLPALRVQAESVELPVFYARWRCLLRSVGSLENFRREHGAGLDPDEVVRFLLFDPHTPRSIHCGLTRMKAYLEQLPGGGGSQAARIAGRLVAMMTYEDDQILANPDLADYFDETKHALGGIHESVERQYFSV
jgi:uncharacterized alpha-E superfamily protein